ncbi:NAD(P)-binding protein [Cylindrobasidium torrendii FP15055 ss-10]|uniref:NAD(P)-binding protein n=1 Tax=Cylindrobasidium torrendii FP15055 ss-10 TaxID=1314674 RepID=A0A0D7AZJ6_9AGAR|nr:NAD(P)-binding protein [Cylindrobasidium torrendii FP15055 ss-10]
MSPSSFSPKNAIVTGAAHGIGRAIALRLAADGLNLVLNDLPERLDLLDTLVKEISSLGVRAVACTGDVGEKSVNDGLVSTCVKEFGSLEVMVCNAGIVDPGKDILNTTYEEVEPLMKVNFKSQWLGCSAAAEQMIKQGTGGRIIGSVYFPFVNYVTLSVLLVASSAVGKQCLGIFAAYSATKFSSRALAQSAAQEWGQYGITVNTYCPGYIQTELSALLRSSTVPQADPNQSLAAKHQETEEGMEVKRMWELGCALKRLGKPEDVADVVSFFASKDSRYVTGQSTLVLASMSPSEFNPKNAIVTGAAQGIGRAIALRLAEDGLNVVLNDLAKNQQALDSLAKEVTTKGVKAVVYPGSVSEKSVNEGIVATCVEKFGSLDVMVCNAGICYAMKGILDTPFEEVENFLNINYKSCWLGYSAAAQQMIKQKTGGRIIGASSVASKKSHPMAAPYCASKFCVRALTQSAAQEWGQYGITVNAYCPGMISTPMTDYLVVEKEQYLGVCALKRLGEPEDISGVVSFFASKDSRYVTGQNLIIDGGVNFD